MRVPVTSIDVSLPCILASPSPIGATRIGGDPRLDDEAPALRLEKKIEKETGTTIVDDPSRPDEKEANEMAMAGDLPRLSSSNLERRTKT